MKFLFFFNAIKKFAKFVGKKKERKIKSFRISNLILKRKEANKTGIELKEIHWKDRIFKKENLPITKRQSRKCSVPHKLKLNMKHKNRKNDSLFSLEKKRLLIHVFSFNAELTFSISIFKAGKLF